MFSAFYLAFIGFLMVSSFPTWSFKRLGEYIKPAYVLPFMIGALVLIVVLFSFPWISLTIICLSYLATIPLSVADHKRRTEAQSAE